MPRVQPQKDGQVGVFVARSRKQNGRPTRAYVAWINMKSRCYCETNPDYPKWGGRGIKVCPRWKDSFENFFADMGEPPPRATLGRRDNDGPYGPDNCRWESRAEQSLNKRNNHRITAFGRTQTLAEWSREFGVRFSTIILRLQRGVPAEVAVSHKGYLNINRRPHSAPKPA